MTTSLSLKTLEETLGYSFADSALLMTALTHRSFSNEHKGVSHNERLEFLGDAVLQFVSTTELFSLFPNVPEGVLSNYRSLLVKTEYLLAAAERLSLREYFRVSEGQKRDLREGATPFLADGVEALIGAVYLDGGLTAARSFILTKVVVDIQAHLRDTPLQDSKTVLQEYTQRERHITPEYSLVKETGPDHDRMFTVAVHVGTDEVATAEGKSKRKAEQLAAQRALDLLKEKGREIG